MIFFRFVFAASLYGTAYYVIARVHWSRDLFQRNKTNRVLNVTLNLCFVPTWTHLSAHNYILCDIKFVDSQHHNTQYSVLKRCMQLLQLVEIVLYRSNADVIAISVNILVSLLIFLSCENVLIFQIKLLYFNNM